MPVYEYRCPTCQQTFTKLQPFASPTLQSCPDCLNPAPRQLSLFNFKPLNPKYTSAFYGMDEDNLPEGLTAV